jgi:hypothetical protein
MTTEKLSQFQNVSFILVAVFNDIWILLVPRLLLHPGSKAPSDCFSSLISTVLEWSNDDSNLTVREVINDGVQVGNVNQNIIGHWTTGDVSLRAVISEENERNLFSSTFWFGPQLKWRDQVRIALNLMILCLKTQPWSYLSLFSCKSCAVLERLSRHGEVRWRVSPIVYSKSRRAVCTLWF